MQKALVDKTMPEVEMHGVGQEIYAFNYFFIDMEASPRFATQQNS